MPSRSVKKRSYNQSKKRRKSRKQIGGAVFSAAQLTELGALGFTDEQITEFSDLLETQAANEPGLPASVITFAKRYLEQINPQTGRNRTPRELIDYHIELHSDETFGGKRRRKGRKQIGGTVFEEQELTELGTLGFNDDQKKELARRLALNSTVAMNYIRQSLQQINPQTGQVFTPQELIDSLVVIENNNVNDLSDIESDSDDEHNLSELDDELHAILNGDDEEPMTPPPRTEGGRRRKSGKTKKSKKTRKSKKNKKSRKMKGGAKYGTGVGANNFDPNYSIYNTQALNQFPYKPN